MSSERVLLLGSGGREHAIASKLSQSELLQHVYVAPGNAGTQASTQANISNVDVPVKKHVEVVAWCKNNFIDLVVVGPEDPLANGIQDDLAAAGLSCFGPSKAAAQIEASKEFAKEFMVRHDIPTARWMSFTDSYLACQHIGSAPYKALVIKVNGLAAGKGVTVAGSIDEAKAKVKSLFEESSKNPIKIIVEELLEGQEVSVLCFSDGKNIKVMPPSQDYKRLSDGDQGPNTGGMGAYCPCPWVSAKDLKMIEEDILQKTVSCLGNEGIPYKGVLYAGLMITENGPHVLEFNCRFGDPETQVILPLLKSDLYAVMKSCVEGRLDLNDVVWDADHSTVAVVLVSSGYPGPYPKCMEITGIEEVNRWDHLHVVHAGTCRNETGDLVLTNGGRVLAVVAKASTPEQAIGVTQKAARHINFEGKFCRTDIGYHAVMRKNQDCLTYASSGISISAGNELVSQIKSLTDKTSTNGVLGSIGGFGGIFDLKAAGYGDDTLLISGTDGVGTKLLIAQQSGMHATIGTDLVAMCVNDVLCHGAEPLFFLDYFACGKLNVQVTKSVIEGIADGCRQAGCALIGGETAEMPGMYPRDKYDLAGFCVGAVPKHSLLPRLDDIGSGDVIIGIASSGLHSNGFSLVRKIVQKSGFSYDDIVGAQPLGELLLTPTKIYTRLLPLIKKAKAFIHITGGGLSENVTRVLPSGIGAVLDASQWTIPSVFGWLASQGNVCYNEMLRTFNCGIGAALILDKNEDVNNWLEDVDGTGEKAWQIGQLRHVNPDENRVEVKNVDNAFRRCTSQFKSPAPKQVKRVAVLISGSGTNLQALINASHDSNSCYQIALVISNVEGVEGLKRSQRAGIKSEIIKHKDYQSRELFDSAIHEALLKNQIEFVCLAGFMRILSGSFVNKWQGRLLNTHPSLLPAFRGMHAARQALSAGVTVTGCTVHFVSEELDAGAIIAQEVVPVQPDDDENTLQERIKQSEHVAFPRALQLLTSNAITLSDNGKIKWRTK